MYLFKRFAVCAYLTLVSSYAKSEPPGVWHGWKTDDANFAGVSNDSDSVLAKMCLNKDNSCYWVLYLKDKCEVGVATPVLMNARSGSISVELTCIGPADGGYHVLGTTDIQKVEQAVTSGGVAGIALPLDAGEFSVVRFNVDGAASSLKALAAAAKSPSLKKPTAIGNSRL